MTYWFRDQVPLSNSCDRSKRYSKEINYIILFLTNEIMDDKQALSISRSTIFCCCNASIRQMKFPNLCIVCRPEGMVQQIEYEIITELCVFHRLPLRIKTEEIVINLLPAGGGIEESVMCSSEMIFTILFVEYDYPAAVLHHDTQVAHCLHLH